MNIKDTIEVQRSSFVTTQTVWQSDGSYHLQPTVNYSAFGGLTKLEYFMLEITKAVVINSKYGPAPKQIVNTAQLIFEELKKRIEDIESKGLLSDNKL